MKSIMPLVENARQLRLQGVEKQQLQQRRDSAQSFLRDYAMPGGGQPASGAAMPGGFSLTPLQQQRVRYAIANSPTPGQDAAELISEFREKAYTRQANVTQPISHQEMIDLGYSPNVGTNYQIKNGDISPIDKNGVEVSTTVKNDLYGNPLIKRGATAIYELKDALKAGSEDAANRIRPQRVMLQALTARTPDGNSYVMDTGAWAALSSEHKNLWNSLVDDFAPEAMAKALSVGDQTYAQLFNSTQKSSALISAALMKGNLSEKELQFSLDIQASLKNTREASIFLTNMQIIREESRIAEYDYMLNWNANLSPEQYAKTLNKAGEQDGHNLHSMWESELNRYRRNDARELNSKRIQDVWAGLGYVNLGTGYNEISKYTPDQLEALPQAQKNAMMKAMRLSERAGGYQ
jgi:hypothetical protein